MEHKEKEKMKEEMIKILLGFANETGITVTGININWIINTDISGQRDPIFVVSDIKVEAKIY
jgi:hypothetical protein